MVLNQYHRYEERVLTQEKFPDNLKEIPDAPDKLYIKGALPDTAHQFLTVVGARRYSDYGRSVCEKLIAGLRGYPIVIVSGLALGIDTFAHRAALAAKLPTVAIPGSGLGVEALYPKSNHGLAEMILVRGGALISEFKSGFKATPWSFPQRNRIMAGIGHAVLVVEAEKKSGTLITSRLATDYNREVLTIPGSIFSKTSEGPFMLIRLGATPVATSGDIIEALGIEAKTPAREALKNVSKAEQKILYLIREPITRDQLIEQSGLPLHEAQVLISRMEINGIIEERLGTISIR